MLYDPKWEQKTETTEPWRTIIWKAAALIEANGLCKGRTIDEENRHCMVGAINEIDTGDACTLDRSQAGDQATTRLHRFCGGNLVDYNNRPERTAEEVVAKMRACAGSQ